MTTEEKLAYISQTERPVKDTPENRKKYENCWKTFSDGSSSYGNGEPKSKKKKIGFWQDAWDTFWNQRKGGAPTY